MKKQFLLAGALLFTATAYSQINPEHGIKVRTIARTETESNGTAVSTVAADGSQSPAKARGGKTDRIKGKVQDFWKNTWSRHERWCTYWRQI